MKLTKTNINRIVDRLGMKIDPGIKETVVELNRLGFLTNGSCEGHAEHGMCGPWVSVGFKDIDEWYQRVFVGPFNDPEVKEKEAWQSLKKAMKTDEYNRLSIELEQIKKRLECLISDFYQSTGTKSKFTLYVEGIVPSLRIQSADNYPVKNLKVKRDSDCLAFHSLALTEMQSFCDFLKTLEA